MLSTLEARSDKAPAQAHSNNASQRRAADWLLERIQKGRKEPFSEIVTLTPEIAALLLDSNDGNRNQITYSIDNIAADIEAGRFQFNGESIVVASDGSLNDGQHRCAAVIKTGMSIRTNMVFGASRDSRETTDIGRTRRVSDLISMGGGTNANHAATVAKNLLLHTNNYSSFEAVLPKFTKSVILDYYKDRKEEIDVALHATSSRFFRRIGWAAMATSYVIINRSNSDNCAEFFARLDDGTGLKKGNPIWALRESLQALKSGTKIAPKIELIIRHWNKWRSGTSVNRTIVATGSIPAAER